MDKYYIITGEASMEVTIILQTKFNEKDALNERGGRIREIQFRCLNAPKDLLIGDKFQLSLFEGHNIFAPEVVRRIWRGQELWCTCETEHRLLEMLVTHKGAQDGTEVPGYYSLPDQEWEFQK